MKKDSNFHCGGSGIALQNMVNSQVAVVIILLETEGFLLHHCDRRLNLRISLISLNKILHYAGDEDTLALMANDNPDTLNLYDIKLRDIYQEHQEILKTDYTATITILSTEFHQLLESVAIEASEECIKFSSSSDIRSGSALLGHNNDYTEPVALTFLLCLCRRNLCSGFCQIIPLLHETSLSRISV
ncbi:hypothetical protein L873DRAFT_1836555 [Choiromyces venosus 120613-1]|uniref:Proliferating cell nuclear antigen PCNA N-terminal domain-containing protein n=1 Tax=Choiromyces venosus 120613-1 TaxID=1336337 RepID=A0A3N4JFQ7_9PEZI|nr:hypothetical protein L873DRAFT_1836555 [Choiromyces venosus 120613-1]